MTLTSFPFFVFLGISFLLYYIVPRRFQWILLLISSAVFFVLSCNPYTVIYLLITIISTAFSAKKIEYWRTIASNETAENGSHDQQKKSTSIARRWFIGTLAINLGLLFLLKYERFAVENTNAILNVIHSPYYFDTSSYAVPIGISYYTLQAAGYLTDVYWGTVSPQKSYSKTALFLGAFPQLTSGPISRYSQMEGQLYSGHPFQYREFTSGVVRILWGLFKKLVISTRAGILVDTIYASPEQYPGIYIWFAAAMFMMQLYADFSGCMDIVIGTAECYGIKLPVNFKTPFFSRSVQEYWQRWHITLGSWLKDYILYPVLHSTAWKSLTHLLKKQFGKKAARLVPTHLGMLVVWLLIGLWHGGNWKYIIGMGLWFWLCIVLGQIFEPFFKKAIQLLKIKTDCFSWHLFQSIRVFILVSLGNMFFRIDSLKEAFFVIGRGFSVWNPWILFDGSLYKLGLDRKDFEVLVISLFALLLVSAMNEKKPVRERLSGQNIVFRWIIVFSLLLGTIVFGMYGQGFNAADFIYRGF